MIRPCGQLAIYLARRWFLLGEGQQVRVCLIIVAGIERAIHICLLADVLCGRLTNRYFSARRGICFPACDAGDKSMRIGNKFHTVAFADGYPARWRDLYDENPASADRDLAGLHGVGLHNYIRLAAERAHRVGEIGCG